MTIPDLEAADAGKLDRSIEVVSTPKCEGFRLIQRSIRLIEVLPNLSKSGRIQFRLFHATTRSRYQCLSYRWGNADGMHFIDINEAPFAVQSNLWSFLEAIRSTLHCTLGSARPSGAIWIDAISIDQESPAERNHQVRQMGHCYGSAYEVIIWLGGGDPTTKRAYELL